VAFSMSLASHMPRGAGRNCRGACPNHRVMRGRHLRGARQSLGDLPAILVQMDDAKHG
jgi:hypothetical protein